MLGGGFWIWVMVVMLYMWILSRYLMPYFSRLERVKHIGNSRMVCCIGKSLLVVF